MATTELHIAFGAFANKIRGTEAEIYTKLLRILHGTEKHTMTEWKAVLEGIRSPDSPAKASVVADALIPTISDSPAA